MRVCLIPALVAVCFVGGAQEPPLATATYKVVGVRLAVMPGALSVPKGVAGSVLVEVVAGEGVSNEATAALAAGAIVEATLSGPGVDSRRLVGVPNEPLLLPPLNVTGDYSLAGIRLVDATTGEVRLEAPAVPIQVFDEVLVSRVTSRPLTLDEIEDRGIVIDEQNFRAVEFEVGFVVDGQTVPVRFPVVSPSFSQSTEIIPDAEINDRLAEAAALNAQLSGAAELPPALEAANLNIEVRPINFQFVIDQDEDLELQVPPIPALMVIPGNIGYLNQFFSVQLYTENAAPTGSGLSVTNVQAKLRLPAGADRIAGTYEAPGDDPLRPARVGDNAEILDQLPVVQPGADGEFGTDDDVERLRPGQTGQAEFLVEGLQEGLHLLDIDLTASLEGLAAGAVEIRGGAAGSVLVRNPTFSMAFSHPRTTRAGEPYTARVTVLNTSNQPANLVQVSLSQASLSGGILESDSTVELGSILPGETATAAFQVRAQRTGSITFSNLTTGDDSLVGRFRLKMGIDERGVALSPDTIIMPDYVDELPQALVNAANRVLGQALSVATAPLLPAGIKPVRKSIINKRVVELAEAGQRLRYGDTLDRILADLLLDWQGARNYQEGFDQILRETDAGREFREVLTTELETADGLNANERLVNLANDLAARGETWTLATTTTGTLSAAVGDKSADVDASEISQTAGYDGASGQLLAALPQDDLVFNWRFTDGSGQTVQVLELADDGAGRLLSWTLAARATAACLSYDPNDGSDALHVDVDCNGTQDDLLPATITPVVEAAPAVLAVLQDTAVENARPRKLCLLKQYANYGNVVAVLFSKPLAQSLVNVPSAYVLDDGNAGRSVRMQPGGRVALVSLSRAIGTIYDRQLTVNGIVDGRGTPVPTDPIAVQTILDQGVAIKGRVTLANGAPATNVPVTLTMYDERDGGIQGCVSHVVRAAQVRTDDAGCFRFDMVLAGLQYSVSATNTTGLSDAAVDLILEGYAGDKFAAEKLQELANQPSVQNTLLAEFAVGAIPQAIALAEGIDRALLRDFVASDSGRVGTEVAVALQFRGRGTVVGDVIDPDGLPVADAAVNLFPDPDSRELGRGIFSDSGGNFAFYGVPLGEFTIEVVARDGTRRIISEVIETVDEIKTVTVQLTGTEPVLTSLQGRVLENDQSSHAKGRVYVGKFINGRFKNVVAVVTADAQGLWRADNVPVDTYDVVALSFDGKRKGERRDVVAVDGATTTVDVTLQGRTTVSGRVETSTGVPVPNALVAGGESLVRTDANGLFTLTGVPTGRRTISAGLERDPDNGIDFPRLGSASLDVVAGIQNSVVVRLRAAGRIIGRVLDVNGDPVPNVTVALPQTGGFNYVEADENGDYAFENLALKSYTVSAPGPVANDTDTSAILDTLANSDSQNEILAAIGDAYEIFTGVNDPILNGQGATFNPLTWGFNKTKLTFDGQTAVADIRFLRKGTVSGVVLNPQDVPIGARVRLTGLGPKLNGDVGTIIRGERNSDPATGTFEFPGQAFVGNWGLQAATPFYPIVITASGETTSVSPDATGIILKFPADQPTNGRLAGTVLNPYGDPVGAGVEVKISFGDDYVITTDEDGRFDTQIDLPATDSQGRPGRSYTVEGHDVANGWQGRTIARLVPDVTTDVELRLIGRGDLDVTVVQADGSPAPGAQITIEQRAFPYETFADVEDGSRTVTFPDVFASSYSVRASYVSGLTTISGRASVTVPLDGNASVTVTLAPTGTIRGTFVRADGSAVPFAQISIGNLGLASTDQNGDFELGGVPLGTYRLTANDPVNGLGAVGSATISYDGQIVDVTLAELARGAISGRVIGSYGDTTIPGATVRLTVDDGLSSPRTVTTGPDGEYQFPGVPAANFQLSVEDPVTGRRGNASGTLAADVEELTVDVQLQPLASLTVTVYEPDGATPAANATVTIAGYGSVDTDALGQAFYTDLPLGGYTVTAVDKTADNTRSINQATTALTEIAESAELAVILRGVGEVGGTVLLSDGVSPAVGATVVLKMLSPYLNTSEQAITDASGNFAFINVPVGNYRLSAQAQALGASYNGEISVAGEVDDVDLQVGDSGSVIGILTENDGTTIVPNVEVLLEFDSQSGLPGRATTTTDAAGAFRFDNVPVGDVELEALYPAINGVARTTAALTTNGEERDLGTVLMDQEDPEVVDVFPANTAVGIEINTVIEVTFSETMDEDSFNSGGIYVRDENGNPIAATMAFVAARDAGSTTVRLTPNQPLASEVTFEVVVIDGDRISPTGGILASGPTDLVDRGMLTPFISSFTTADQDPPDLISFTPEDGTEAVDIQSVVRLSFNEPVVADELVVSLSTPARAPVTGSVDVGLNGLVIVFTPDQFLDPNGTYTASVSGVRDEAGNVADNQPFTTTFYTTDTIGPELLEVRIKDAQSPVAGTEIVFEAVFATPEDGATARFSIDGEVVASTDGELPFTLPQDGTVDVSAVPVDRFGNEGDPKSLTVTVEQNDPPEVTFTRIVPASGPVPSGNEFTIDVSASDDSEVVELRAFVGGGLTIPVETSNGTTIRMTGLVGPEIPPNTTIFVYAEAIDNTGLSSGEQALQFQTSDGSGPIVTISASEVTGLIDPGVPFDIVVSAPDNVATKRLEFTASGLATANEAVDYDPTVPNPVETFTVTVPANNQQGGTVTFNAQANDALLNFGFADPLTLSVRRTLPWQIVGSSPADAATEVSPNFHPYVDSDQRLDATSIDGRVRLLDDQSSEVPSTFTVTNQGNGSRLQLTPDEQLTPNSNYTWEVDVDVLDEFGNPLNTAFSAGFQTADAAISISRPIAEVIFPEGEPIELTTSASPAEFVDHRDYYLDGVLVSQNTTRSSILLPSAAARAERQLVAQSIQPDGQVLLEATRTFESMPRDVDTDGDGLTDRAETAAGTNPNDTADVPRRGHYADADTIRLFHFDKPITETTPAVELLLDVQPGAGVVATGYDEVDDSSGSTSSQDSLTDQTGTQSGIKANFIAGGLSTFDDNAGATETMGVPIEVWQDGVTMTTSPSYFAVENLASGTYEVTVYSRKPVDGDETWRLWAGRSMRGSGSSRYSWYQSNYGTFAERTGDRDDAFAATFTVQIRNQENLLFGGDAGAPICGAKIVHVPGSTVHPKVAGELGFEGKLVGDAFVTVDGEHPFGDALYFDHTMDTVEIPWTNEVMPEGTIEFWVKPYGSGNYMSVGELFGFTSSWLNFNYSGGNLSFSRWTGGSSTAATTAYASDDWYGKWHHVCVNWGSEGMRLFIDYQLLATNGYDNPLPAQKALILGGHSWGSQGRGIYDELRVLRIQRDPVLGTDDVVDSDIDGLSDAQELAIGTDPGNPDSDGDGIVDDADAEPLTPNDNPPVLVGAVADYTVQVGSRSRVTLQTTDLDGDVLQVKLPVAEIDASDHGLEMLLHFDGNASDATGNHSISRTRAGYWDASQAAVGSGAASVEQHDGYFSVNGGVDLAPQWSVSTWIRLPLPSNSNYNTLMANNSVGEQHVSVQSSNKELGVWSSVKSSFRGTGFLMSSLPNGWHHLAVNAHSGQQDFYLNGALVGTTDVQTRTDIEYLGNNSLYSREWGSFDEFALYNRLLTQEEIAGHAQRFDGASLAAVGSDDFVRSLQPNGARSGDFSFDLVFDGTVAELGDQALQLLVRDSGGRETVHDFDLTVAPVANAPCLDALADQTMGEGEVLRLPLHAYTNGEPLVDLRVSAGGALAYVSGLAAAEGYDDGLELTAELVLTPLFDQAGDHLVTVTAVDDAGATSSQSLTVTVTDDATIQTTSWLAAANGNWSEAGNWSNGVPDGSLIAVVDVAGTYEITIDTTAEAAGLVVDAANVTITVANPLTVGATQLRAGTMTIASTLCLQGPLLSDGTISIADGAEIRGLRNAPYSHYTMDDTYADSGTSKQNAGPYSGPSFVDGVYGRAVYMNGNDAVRDTYYTPPSGDFSLSMWVKSGPDVDPAALFSYAATDSRNNEILLNDHRRLVLAVGSNSQGTGNTVVAVDDDQWHHLAVTWRQADGRVVYYKDGVEVLTAVTYPGGAPIIPGGALYIGQEQDQVSGGLDGNNELIGSIDEVRVYDRVLTAGEVLSDLNGCRGFGALINRGTLTIDSSRLDLPVTNANGSTTTIAADAQITAAGGDWRQVGALTANTGSELTIDDSQLLFASGTVAGSGAFSATGDAAVVTLGDFATGGGDWSLATAVPLSSWGNLTIANATNTGGQSTVRGHFDLAGTLTLDQAVTATITGDLTLGNGAQLAAGTGVLQTFGSLTDDGATLSGNAPAAAAAAPQAEPATFRVSEDNELTGTLTAGNTVGITTFEILGGAAMGTATITDTATGAFSYQPNSDVVGWDSFVFRVSDDQGASAAATASIFITPVNDAPVAPAVAVTTAEDTAVVIQLGGSDLDGDAVTAEITSLPAAGRLYQLADLVVDDPVYGPQITSGGTGVSDSLGRVVFLPDEDGIGDPYATFDYLLNDNSADSANAAVTIEVTPVNDPPVAGFGGSLLFDGDMTGATVVDPGSNLQIGSSSWTISAWIRSSNTEQGGVIVQRYECGWNNCSSPDGNASAYQQLSISGDGHAGFTLRPDGGSITTVRDNRDLRDGEWHQIAGVLDRNTGIVGIIVDGELRNVADASSFGEINDAGSPFTIGYARGYPGVYASPFPGEIDHVVAYRKALSATEAWSLRHDSSLTAFTGDVAVLYRMDAAADERAVDAIGENPAIFGDYLGSTAPARVAGRPQVVSPRWDELPGGDLLVPLTGWDPEDAGLSYAITALPNNGALYQNNNGSRGAQITAAPTPLAVPSVLFVPVPAATGEPYDEFGYTVNDGTFDSQEATVVVNLPPANQAPLLADQTVTTDENQAVTISFAPTDADGDDLTVQVTSLPASGSLRRVDGSGFPLEAITAVPTILAIEELWYEPPTDVTGTAVDTFTVQANDGIDAVTATVTIDVDAVNKPATAGNDSYVANQNGTLSIAAPGFLANDVDPEDDALTVVLVDDVANGTLTFNADGSFDYEPDLDFIGTDHFTYQVTSNGVDANLARVQLTVIPVGSVFWTGATDNNWHNAGNWTSGSVPGIGDKVVIDLVGDYTITLGANAEVASLVMNPASGNQTLHTNGRILTVNSIAYFGPTTTLRLHGGDVAGSADYVVNNFSVTSGGDLRSRMFVTGHASITAILYLYGPLNIMGTGAYTGSGYTYAYSGSGYTVHAGAELTFNTSTNREIHRSSGSTTFRNHGTIVKKGGSSFTIHDVTFENEGLVQVENGDFILSGGTSQTGRFEVEGTLAFRAGTTTLAAGTSVTGSGGLSVTNGTVNLEGDFTLLGHVDQTNGQLNFISDVVMKSFDADGGDLGGGGTISVGTLTWSGGDLEAGGTVTVRDSLSITAVSYWRRDIVLLGTGSVTGAGYLYAYGNPTLTIAAGGQLTLNSSEDREFNQQSGLPRVVNEGTLVKAGSHDFGLDVALDNNGVVRVEQGRLWCHRGGASTTGRFELVGGTLDFSTGTHNLAAGTTVAGGDGVLRVSSAGNLIIDGMFVDEPLMEMTNGDLTINVPVAVSSFSISNGDLWGNGTIAVQSMNVTGGDLNAGGDVTTETYSQTGILYLRRKLTITDAGSITSSAYFYTYSPAELEVAPGATLTFNTSSNRAIDDQSGTSVLDNQGTLIKAGSSRFTCEAAFYNSGTVQVTGGVWVTNRGGTNTGSVDLASGSEWEIHSNEYVFAAGTTVTGEGYLQTVNGALVVADDLTIPRLSLAGGDLRGDGEPTIEYLSWYSGDMDPGGLVTVTQDLDLRGTSKSLYRDLTVTSNGDWLESNHLYFRGDVTFTIGAGATFTMNANNNYEFSRESGNPQLVNNGTLVKVNTEANEIDVSFVNNGIFDIDAGVLRLQRGGSATGTATVAESAFLEFEGGTHTWGSTNSISGAGSVRFDSGTVTFAETRAATPAVATTFAVTDGIFGVGAITQPIGGTVTDNADNTLTYTADAATSGDDPFDYVVGGSSGSATATITMQVSAARAVPDLPGLSAARGSRALDPANEAPFVTWSYPGFVTDAVAVESTIYVAFSESMNPATTQAAFSLTADNQPVIGTFAWSDYGAGTDSLLSFTPGTPLALATEYVLKIDVGAIDLDDTPRALASSYEVTFKTVQDPTTVAPTVWYVEPVAGADRVATDAFIEIGFSEAMNRTAVEAAVVLVRGTEPVAGSFTWLDDLGSDRVVRFIPDSDLFFDTIYELSIADSAVDQDQPPKPLPTAFASSFRTRSDPTQATPEILWTLPADGSAALRPDGAVAVAFSESMDTASTAAAVALSGPNGAIAGTVSWQRHGGADNALLIFTPAQPLSYGTAYSFTVAGSASDLDNPQRTLAAASSIDFTTMPEPASAPQIVALAPWNGAEGVWHGAAVQILFSHPMNTRAVEARFKLGNWRGAVDGRFEWYDGNAGDNSGLTFYPAQSLQPGDSYLIVIGGESVTGVPLGVVKSVFSVRGETAPTIVEQFPSNDAVAVEPGAAIVIAFSEPMARASVEAGFLLTGTAPVSGMFSWTDFGNGPGSAVIFTPDIALADNQNYVVTLASAATNLAGIELDANALTNWSFTTAANALAPPPQVTRVSVDRIARIWYTDAVEIAFSKRMNRERTSAAVALEHAITQSEIPATPAWFSGAAGVDSVLLYVPESPLTPGETYRLRISQLATDANSPARAIPAPETHEFTVVDNRMPLSAGWNFVSMPTTSGQTASEIFPGLRVFGLRVRNWRRQSADAELEPQRAYWVYSRAPATSEAVTGLLAADPLPLRSGINPFGPGAISAPIYDPAELSIWHWKDNDWREQSADLPLELFNGYLLFSPTPRSLQLVR